VRSEIDIIRKLKVGDEIVFLSLSELHVKGKVVRKNKERGYFSVEREDGQRGSGWNNTWALANDGGNWLKIFRGNPNSDILLEL